MEFGSRRFCRCRVNYVFVVVCVCFVCCAQAWLVGGILIAGTAIYVRVLNQGQIDPIPSDNLISVAQMLSKHYYDPMSPKVMMMLMMLKVCRWAVSSETTKLYSLRVFTLRCIFDTSGSRLKL
jgi:hypothetical protein